MTGSSSRTVADAQAALDPWMPAVLAALVLLAVVLAGQRFARLRLESTGAVRGSTALAVAALVLGAGFLAFGLAVQAGWPWIDALDARAAALLGRWPPSLQPLATAATFLGEMLWLSAITVAITLWLLRWRVGALAWGVLLTIVIQSVAVRVLKDAFARARPAEATELVTSGLSFPSGHAAGSMLVYGLLWWLAAPCVAPRWRGAWWFSGAVLILCVGASRVVLGAHFASDVLGGWLLAATFMAAAVAVLRALALGPLNRPSQ